MGDYELTPEGYERRIAELEEIVTKLECDVRDYQSMMREKDSNDIAQMYEHTAKFLTNRAKEYREAAKGHRKNV